MLKENFRVGAKKLTAEVNPYPSPTYPPEILYWRDVIKIILPVGTVRSAEQIAAELYRPAKASESSPT